MKAIHTSNIERDFMGIFQRIDLFWHISFYIKNILSDTEAPSISDKFAGKNIRLNLNLDSQQVLNFHYILQWIENHSA